MALTPSHKPTREWPLLLVAIGLVCAFTLPLWQFSAAARAGSDQNKWTAERVSRLLLGPEQIACYCAFTWACFILGGRYLEVRRQQRAFGLTLLSTDTGAYLLPEDAKLEKRKLEQRAAPYVPLILANLLRLALGKYAVSKSGRDVAETVRTQADVEMGRMVSGMATVHYLAWAIPAIGFLGTVRGLASSLTMGAGEKTKEQLEAFMREATGHLNVAFDCTLIALALSLVVMFFLHAVQRAEEALVLDCQQYCLEHLVTRLVDDGAEAPPSSTSSVYGAP
jgi:biopolymer transport protein ExbB/TolQ